MRLFPLMIVEQNTVRLLSRFGRFRRTLQPGLQFCIPIIDQVTPPVSLKEYTRDFHEQIAITKDGLRIILDCTLYGKVVDPFQYTFGVNNAPKAVEGIAKSLLRCEIGKLSLDEVLQQRQQLNQKLSDEMQTYADRWGMTCSRYEITRVDLESAFQEYMSLEAESERERRKRRLEAQQIEQTMMNDAQRQRVTQINERTVEGKRVYFHMSVWAARIGLLRGFVDAAPQNWGILEAKLKADLIKCYGQLAKEDQQVFMRRDVTQVGQVLNSLYPYSGNQPDISHGPQSHTLRPGKAAASSGSQTGHPEQAGH